MAKTTEKETLQQADASAAEAPTATAAPSEKAPRTITRRSLCLGVGGTAVLLGLGCLSLAPQRSLVRPPGGQDEAALISSCVRCEKCVEVCPRNAISLAHIEDGILSMRTPQMDFYSSYCDFCAEDNGGVPLCTAACPTGALSLPAGVVAEEEVILGKAELIRDWCLAYHDTGCHVCYDACPYEAIELDEHHRPYVIEDKCNGCGACEAVCVSLTNGSRAIAEDATSRAIVVVPEAEFGRVS